MTVNSIQQLSPVGSVQELEKLMAGFDSPVVQDTRSLEASSFMQALNSTDGTLKHADQLAQQYIAGENIPVHEVVIAMNKAKTELQLVVEIRNKILEAYQEISRIQI